MCLRVPVAVQHSNLFAKPSHMWNIRLDSSDGFRTALQSQTHIPSFKYVSNDFFNYCSIPYQTAGEADDQDLRHRMIAPLHLGYSPRRAHSDPLAQPESMQWGRHVLHSGHTPDRSSPLECSSALRSADYRAKRSVYSRWEPGKAPSSIILITFRQYASGDFWNFKIFECCHVRCYLEVQKTLEVCHVCWKFRVEG